MTKKETNAQNLVKLGRSLDFQNVDDLYIFRSTCACIHVLPRGQGKVKVWALIYPFRVIVQIQKAKNLILS